MMTNLDVWEVDRLAAAELIAALGGASNGDLPRIAAEAFARHRIQSHQWAAKRVHQSAVEALEAGASREFDRRDAVWTDGYRYAEHCLGACSPATLLGTAVGPVVSKGQALRRMVRTAKSAGAVSLR